MKTVHGAEFYASKRHKGTNSGGFDSSPRSEGQGGGGGNTNRFDSSPKNTSVSSPSIKSESETNSPDHSPMDGISGREVSIFRLFISIKQFSLLTFRKCNISF